MSTPPSQPKKEENKEKIVIVVAVLCFYGLLTFWLMFDAYSNRPSVVFHRPNSTETHNCQLLNAVPVKGRDDLTEFTFHLEYDHPHATLENWPKLYKPKFRHSSYLPGAIGETIDDFPFWNESRRMGLIYKRRMTFREAFNMKPIEIGLQIVTNVYIGAEKSITVSYNVKCDKEIQKKMNGWLSM